ncbi:MAG: ABC transporter permease [Pseudomonadota bacterium]|nr:ABC transporter permease [Pseudomonadota bacterium]
MNLLPNRISPSLTLRVAGTLLLFIVGIALIGPMTSEHTAEDMDWENIGVAPSMTHWFGTDDVGRDLFVRTMEGTRVSFTVALIATSVALLIGIPWGATAALAGGLVDQIMMRIVDAMYSLPGILIVILLVVLFGRNQYLLFAGIGAIAWLDIARIVRGQTLRLRESPFIDAARSLGGKTTYIMSRHVIPNVAGPIIVYTTLMIPGVILAESFISFLGLGIQEPDTSLGVLVSDGTQVMETSPWILMFPGGLLALTVWSLNTIGDRLRDLTDTHSDQRPIA